MGRNNGEATKEVTLGDGGEREYSERDGKAVSTAANDELAEYVYHSRRRGQVWTSIRSDVFEQYGLDLSVGQIYRLHCDFMSELANSVGPSSKEQIIALENERLDALQEAMWGQAMLGEEKAVNAILKIMAQRSKLNGLDLIDPRDQKLQAQVLIIGNDQQAWIEALAQNTLPPGGQPYNGVEQEDNNE